jgi:hypothetical protein
VQQVRDHLAVAFVGEQADVESEPSVLGGVGDPLDPSREPPQDR